MIMWWLVITLIVIAVASEFLPRWAVTALYFAGCAFIGIGLMMLALDPSTRPWVVLSLASIAVVWLIYRARRNHEQVRQDRHR